VKVRFTLEARLSVRSKRAWWIQHREKAPRLFIEELAAIVAKLRDGADDERQPRAIITGAIVRRQLETLHGALARRRQAAAQDAQPRRKFSIGEVTDSGGHTDLKRCGQNKVCYTSGESGIGIHDDLTSISIQRSRSPRHRRSHRPNPGTRASAASIAARAPEPPWQSAHRGSRNQPRGWPSSAGRRGHYGDVGIATSGGWFDAGRGADAAVRLSRNIVAGLRPSQRRWATRSVCRS
jgi:hypothetical protein